jgi:hypothetical protein
MVKGLGARISDSKPWADKYPLRLGAGEIVDTAERTLRFSHVWRKYYNQGSEGSCVGFSSSEMMTYLNRRRFDARWLWNQAKIIDVWPDTNPGDNQGTSVSAAMDILRTRGHVYVKRGTALPEDSQWGIKENRWATTVDELRTSIQNGVPVVVGFNWYNDFDNPYLKTKTEWFCGQDGWEQSGIRGGHAFMFNAVSDRRQAFRTPNSWGDQHPQVWFPYNVVERLLQQGGEATLVTDR